MIESESKAAQHEKQRDELARAKTRLAESEKKVRRLEKELEKEMMERSSNAGLRGAWQQGPRVLQHDAETKRHTDTIAQLRQRAAQSSKELPVGGWEQERAELLQEKQVLRHENARLCEKADAQLTQLLQHHKPGAASSLPAGEGVRLVAQWAKQGRTADSACGGSGGDG